MHHNSFYIPDEKFDEVLKYVEFRTSKKIFGSIFAFLSNVISSDQANIVICKFIASLIEFAIPCSPRKNTLFAIFLNMVLH